MLKRRDKRSLCNVGSSEGGGKLARLHRRFFSGFVGSAALAAVLICADVFRELATQGSGLPFLVLLRDPSEGGRLN